MSSPSPLSFALFAIGSVMVLKEVNSIVTEPYMDEPFHVPQAQSFCEGNWSHWDDKITTPPGLYVLSIAVQKLFLLKCDLSTLRFTTTLTLLVLPLLCTQLLRQHQRLPSPSGSLLAPSFDAVVLSSFPVLWFFGFLYYTELPSTAFSIASIVAARSGKHYVAASLGLIACTMRQTNVVWVLYGFAYSQLSMLRFMEASPLQDPVFSKATTADFPRALISMPQAIPYILMPFTPYAILSIAFAFFVYLNGGIVLGDKSNHIPVLHVPQLFYFYAFSSALGWPVLLSAPGGPIHFGRQVAQRMFGSRRSIAATITAMGLVVLCIAKFTIHHPFLLSDNRHYTFYVWHRFFLYHKYAPLVFAPGYVFCFVAWAVRVGADQTLLQVTLLPLALIPTLLPTPLLEPRYFILPYILLRAQVTEVPNWGLLLEGFWYICVNGVTMWVFLYRERPDVGRFMW